jgi:hypothetical protein
MLHRMSSLVAGAFALGLGLGSSQPVLAGAGTIMARAQVISDHPSRAAVTAGAAYVEAWLKSDAKTASHPSLLAIDGLAQLSIQPTIEDPRAERLLIEYVAN